jgi:hypothetical protein
MTAERDISRILRSWLRRDEHESAERILHTVLSRLDTTPQRRSWWPARRSLQMQRLTQMFIAAAAVLVVAVVGYSLVPRPTNDQGPTATASPLPTAAPIATAMAWPRGDAPMKPGAHTTQGSPFGVGLTATVPTGWEGKMGGPYFAEIWRANAPGGLSFHIPSQVPVDACDPEKGFVDFADDSVATFVAAMRALPRVRVSGVRDLRVDGYRATELTITAPKAYGSCTLQNEAELPLWKLPLGLVWSAAAGGTLQVTVVDISGVRLAIVADDAGNSDSKAAMQAIIDSIELEPAS